MQHTNLDHRKTAIKTFFNRHWRVYINHQLRNPAIEGYLHSENEQLENVLREKSYDTVIEAGCADGSFFLPVVLNHNVTAERPVSYYGIDLIEDAIREAAERLAEYKKNNPVNGNYFLIQEDICHLRRIHEKHKLDGSHCIIAFPFNIFGTLACPSEVISEAFSLGCDLLIFTYATLPIANTLRKVYYVSCGVGDVEETEDDKGVLFSTAEGLHTYAYHEHVINGWILSAGFKIRDRLFANGLGRVVYAYQEKQPAENPL